MFVENKLNRCQTKHALILCFVEEDSNSICSTQGNQFKRIILQMILKWLSVETKYRNKIFPLPWQPYSSTLIDGQAFQVSARNRM